MRQQRKVEYVVTTADGNGALIATPTRKRSWVALPFHLVEPFVLAADFVVVVATSVLAQIAYKEVERGYIGDVVAFVGFGVLFFINFAAITAARGLYKPQALADFPRQVRELTATWLAACALLLLIAFSLKVSDSFSRGLTITFFMAEWFALICWRAVLARSLTRAFANGGFAEQRIVVLGAEGRVETSKTIQDLSRCGYNPVRTFELSLGQSEASASSATRRVLEDLIEACRRDRIDHVFLQVSWQYRRAIEEIMSTLRVLSIPIHLLPDENVAYFLGNRVATIGTGWSAELKRAPLTQTEQVLKRAIDLVLASLGLVMLAPLMIVVGAIVRLESPGPVFFVQTRNGFNGRTFGVRKFRTMRVTEDGPVIRQATRNDPRVTRVGALLRRTSIDELPQLFNVIAGDMSLVGPRPHAVAHNSEYQKLIGNYAYRYQLKPGITGWAQVNGLRGETKSVDMMARRVEFDLWYINNWSLWLDVKILFRTVLTGLHPNAY